MQKSDALFGVIWRKITIFAADKQKERHLVMKYLDPKADLTFKKVFGEHPDLVISLLNALLPFDRPEEEVQSIEYLPAELVPENPLRKNSIVDVRCKDARGDADGLVKGVPEPRAVQRLKGVCAPAGKVD